MAITSAVCQSYTAEILSGTHASGDIYMAALYVAASASLDGTTTAYTTTGEVTGTGYVAGGQALSGFTAALRSGKGTLDFTAPAWPNSTLSADGMLIYNATRANKAVAVIAFDKTYVSTNGTFTGTMPTPGAATSLVRIG